MNKQNNELRVQRYFRRIVGTMVLATAVLGYFHSPYWLFGTMFIGLNLIQYSFTNWCPLMIILERFAGK